jgi:hypothetical protein
MDNLQSMRVVNRTHHLLKNAASGNLRHATIIDDVVEELSFSVFNDHNDVCRGGNDLVPVDNDQDLPSWARETGRDSQLDNMRMTQQTQVGDLAADASAHVEGIDSLLRDKLESNFGLGQGVNCDWGRMCRLAGPRHRGSTTHA